MEKVVEVRKIGPISRFADWLMVPLMYLISGTFRERPQRTHAWNVQNLTREEAHEISSNLVMLAFCEGVPAIGRWGFLFHIPLLGGWRNFVVLEPNLPFTDIEWRIGWITSDVGAQMSKVPQHGPVRMLIGNDHVYFFGVTAEGKQIPLREIGSGQVGDNGPFAAVPLC